MLINSKADLVGHSPLPLSTGAILTRVAILDDQPLVHAGLRKWLDVPRIELVAGWFDKDLVPVTSVAVGRLILISESRLNNQDAVGDVLRLCQSNPSLSVIFFSAFDNPTLIAAALAGKAAGYLLKNTDQHSFLRAIDTVATGGTTWTREQIRRLNGALSSPRMQGGQDISLTRRENDILRHVAGGLTNKQIATLFSVSAETIKEHIKRACQKIGVRDRTQAALWVARMQLL